MAIVQIRLVVYGSKGTDDQMTVNFREILYKLYVIKLQSVIPKHGKGSP